MLARVFGLTSLGLLIAIAALGTYSYGRITGLKAEVEGLHIKADSKKEKLDQLIASNESLETTIDSCESKLITSKSNQKKALEEAQQKINQLKKESKESEVAYLNLLETPECKAWSEKPSCVVP